MSLREEMWKYEQITGESAEHVPIIKLGAFLDGYDMGVKALEQTELNPSYNSIKTELEPCEDCISREALRKELITITEWNGDVHRYIAEESLDNAPSVVPKQKVGKWIELGIVMEGRMYEHGECDMQDAWGCDYCGYQVHMPTKYCPNCGSKMEVEK